MKKLSKLSKILSMAGLAMVLPGISLANGLHLGINGSLKSETKAATKLELKSSIFTGPVTSINGNDVVFTSSSTSYTADVSNATLVRHFGGALLLGDIQVGDKVQVSGAVNGTTITAKILRDISLQQKNGMFSGTVLSASSTSFTIQSKARGVQTININSSTVFKKNDQTASFADVTIGANVNFSGVWDRTNSNVTASKINVVIPKVNKTGTIQSISASTLTVLGNDGVTYIVNAANAKLVRRFGAAMVMADFQNGDMVSVHGPITGNAIAATLVRDQSLQARNGTFTGTISAINGSSFTLQSRNRGLQTINTASTTVFKLGDVVSSLTALSVGQTVVVNGVWDRTNTNVTASKVLIRVNHVNIYGTFQSASGTSLSILSNGSNYTVDAGNATVKSLGDHVGTVASLQDNDKIVVTGQSVSGSSVITAKTVRDTSRTF